MKAAQTHPIGVISLTQQRDTLQRQLQAHRLLIAQQLNPEDKNNLTYPRSMTMRFITSHVPKLITQRSQWLASAAAVALGIRWFTTLRKGVKGQSPVG